MIFLFRNFFRDICSSVWSWFQLNPGLNYRFFDHMVCVNVFSCKHHSCMLNVFSPCLLTVSHIRCIIPDKALRDCQPSMARFNIGSTGGHSAAIRHDAATCVKRHFMFSTKEEYYVHHIALFLHNNKTFTEKNQTTESLKYEKFFASSQYQASVDLCFLALKGPFEPPSWLRPCESIFVPSTAWILIQIQATIEKIYSSKCCPGGLFMTVYTYCLRPSL